MDGRILVRHSAAYVPTQLSLARAEGATSQPLTDTRTPAYRAIAWQAPEYVAVSSRHDAGAPIHSKFYPARGAADADGRHPVVIFVHGAGYTQNTHHKFPYYFREQMFHNLLTARGYHVLDMDYRASRGYGRDWRTAIYRRMGTPEVDPEAYRRSSPIEFVEKLQGPMLISHGMLDDNVFYKDSVRLVQRLIDLEKTDWELASYPLEPHGFVHAESWLDQYRRILKLLEETIGN